MRKRLLAGLGLLVLTSSSLSAQTLTIDHQAVGCAVAEKFPRLEARFAPGDAIATARVLFQPENTQQWYAVAMKSEGPAFSGVLPKPKKSLKAYRYYIEVTDKSLRTNRTADYTTNVVDSPSACKGKIMAAALGSASVLLQVPAGAAALPAGFASTGVVAAGSGSAAAATGAAAGGGGGLSTGAVVGIVAGAGAAAAGVAVAVAQRDVSTVTSYTGPFSGTLTSSFPSGNRTCVTTHTLSGTLTIGAGGRLSEQMGDAGAFFMVGTNAQIEGAAPNACGTTGTFSIDCTGRIPGTPGSLAFKQVCPGGQNSDEFSGALNGGVISGTLTFSFLPGSTVNGSVSMPVTLRLAPNGCNGPCPD